MSGAELLAVIGVLAPLLSASAKLVHRIRDRRRKKKEDEKAILQKFLETALGEGELEIRSTYERYVRQLGDPFRRGDDISRLRVEQHILEAQNIKRVLQLAWDQNKDIKDIQEQWKSATAIPRETRQTMEELSLRLMGPNTGTFSVSHDSLPSETFNSVPPNRPPPAVPFSPSTTRSATLVDSPTPTTAPAHPMGGYVQEPESSHTGHSESHLPQTPPCEVPEHLIHPALRTIKPNPADPLPSIPLTKRTENSPEVLQTRLGSPKQTRGSITSLNSSLTSDSRGSVAKALPILPTSPKSPKPVPRESIRGGQRDPLIGRPDKKNNFHGFCEGAWTIQRNIKDGMEAIYMPAGMVGTVLITQCRKCRFRAEHFGSSKKDWFLDQRVWSSKCEIRYRYSFLAKSHQPCKETFVAGEKINTKMAAQKFGCIFCWAEGVYTDSFGGLESLMNHILLEHRQVREDTQKRTKCIIGRVANASEDFDINIPTTTSPSEKSVPSVASLSIKEREENLLDLDNDPDNNQLPVLDFTHHYPSTGYQWMSKDLFLPPEVDNNMLSKSR